MNMKKILLSTITVIGYCLLVIGMTSCEGADLYSVNAPDWIKSKADSIANNNKPEELEGMMEDVYTIGATDYSQGWWSAWTKYYVIPEGQTWNAEFNLNINPSAPNTYKNYALIITNDEDRGAGSYKEYGAIRYDNQPSGNSEWGDYIDRSLVESNLTFETDTDEGVQKLGGKVTLTIDRSEGGLIVKMTNGTVTKTYTQKTALVNLNDDASNTNIRAFLVPEGSFINWLTTNIEPIGGCTSAEDKLPLSMTLNGVPKKVLVGTDLVTAFANITATVEFEQAVTKTVPATDLMLQAIPDMNTLGTKTIVAVYNKSYKGDNCSPVMATAQFDVVDKMFTSVGATDNSGAFWSAHSNAVKVAPGETFVSYFTNYTAGGSNWNNFLVVLASEDGATEYAVLRADNYGWGNGYAACTPVMEAGRDWATWLAAMDGAKVTTFVTNNGDGTADVKCIMIGNDGVTYTQEYTGVNTVDPDNFYFHFTIEKAHLEFDTVIGDESNTGAFWSDHSENIQVPVGKTYAINFINYTDGGANWNNFLIALTSEDRATEYAILRADNYGWGNGYAACTPIMEAGRDWATWLAAMDGAKVTTFVTNNGDGTADVKCIMIGNDGVTYTQEYNGVNTIDPNNFYFHFTLEKAHLVFE